MNRSENVITVIPQSDVAKFRFETEMNRLHTCRVIHRTDSELYVESANRNYHFIIQKDNDSHWKIVPNV
jgi:hypothetical protein